MKQRGFTLAEIMIVISIIAALSVFLVRNFAKEARTTVVDRAAAQIIDVRRAVLSHFVSIGSWPDGENSCANAAEVLRTSVGALQQNPLDFPLELSCPTVAIDRVVVQEDQTSNTESVPTQPAFRIRQRVSNGSLARALASRLPSTTLVAEGSGDAQAFYVDTYVAMAMLPRAQDISNQVGTSQGTDGRLNFRRIRCGAGEIAQVLLTPRRLCAAGGLFGFRLTWEPVVNSQASGSSSLGAIEFEVQNSDGTWSSGFDQCSSDDGAPLIGIFQYCEAAPQ